MPRKSSSLELLTAIDETSRVIRQVSNQRQSKRDEVFNIRSPSEGRLLIRVSFTEFDQSRTRLRQRKPVELEVEVEQSKSGCKVRYPDHPRAHEIISDITSEIENKGAGVVKEITLRGITTAAKRTRFFILLMKNIKGMTLENVMRIGVHKNKLGSDDKDDKSGDASAFSGLIRKAVLDGESVLQTKEYADLTGRGFFVHKSVWTVRAKASDGVKAEFEAEFKEPDQGTQFIYRLRGVYRRKSSGEFNKTKSAADASEVQTMTSLLEDTARASASQVASQSGTSFHSSNYGTQRVRLSC